MNKQLAETDECTVGNNCLDVLYEWLGIVSYK